MAAIPGRIGARFGVALTVVCGETSGGGEALLDPLGHLHFQLRAQQRDLADLLQVGMDRVFGCAGSEVLPTIALGP